MDERTEANDTRTDANDKPAENPLRVLVTDDHQLVLEGLKELIESTGEAEVVGEAHSGEEAVELVRHLDPDVVCMDVSLPGISGVEATRRIKKQNPGVRVIGLSVHQDADIAASMKKAGASAYLMKDAGKRDLLSALLG